MLRELATVAVAAAGYTAGVLAPPPEPANDWGNPAISPSDPRSGANFVSLPHENGPRATYPGRIDAVPGAYLDERTGCRIARFGAAPWDEHHAHGPEWRRASRIALMRMGLPLDAANQALHMIDMGAVTDIVGMGGTGGTATVSRQRYLPVFSTTYMKDGQRVVCHDSRASFKDASQREYAALYVVGPYHVAVFQRCGNVSRLFVSPDAAEPGIDVVPAPGIGPDEVAHHVPEPGTLALVLVGLVGLFFRRKN